MRDWGKNIVIDGSYYDSPLAKQRGVMAMEQNAPYYEKTVQSLLRDLETKSAVARVIIRAITCSSRQLRIIPLTLAEVFSPTSRGSWPVATDYWGAQSTAVKGCVGKFCFAGTGAGSDIVLNYEPYSTDFLDFAIDPGNNRQPDDALFHELVHCLRMMRGKNANFPIQGPYKYVEELYAILITNMYVGQVGRIASLRGNYEMTFKKLPGMWHHSAWDFYHDYKREIDRLCHEMPCECGQFAQMDGFWNPFRVRNDEQLAMRS